MEPRVIKYYTLKPEYIRSFFPLAIASLITIFSIPVLILKFSFLHSILQDKSAAEIFFNALYHIDSIKTASFSISLKNSILLQLSEFKTISFYESFLSISGLINLALAWIYFVYFIANAYRNARNISGVPFELSRFETMTICFVPLINIYHTWNMYKTLMEYSKIRGRYHRHLNIKQTWYSLFPLFFYLGFIAKHYSAQYMENTVVKLSDISVSLVIAMSGYFLDVVGMIGLMLFIRSIIDMQETSWSVLSRVYPQKPLNPMVEEEVRKMKEELARTKSNG